jgi:hypothetical protein
LVDWRLNNDSCQSRDTIITSQLQNFQKCGEIVPLQHHPTPVKECETVNLRFLNKKNYFWDYHATISSVCVHAKESDEEKNGIYSTVEIGGHQGQQNYLQIINKGEDYLTMTILTKSWQWVF